jgi:hypothetical protein
LLVDLSASVTRCRPAHSAWLREALLEATREARAAREEVLVVAYAADVDAIYGPGPASGCEDLLLGRGGALWHARAGAAGDLASDLCAALDLARSELCAEGRAGGELEIFGDGAASDGEPRERLAALAEAGVSVRRMALPPSTEEDLALVALVGPEELESGAPLALAVDLDLAPAADEPARARQIELALDLVHATRTLHETRTLELPADAAPADDGRIHWSARVDLGVVEDGLWDIEARVRTSDASGRAGDPIPENDRASTAVRVGGSLVAALVRSAESASELGDWLLREPRIPGVEIVLAEPAELAARLSDVDLLISVDVAPADLPGALLGSFVRRGGGWLALDGWRAVASGGLVSDLVPGAAAELLPLLADPEDAGDRDVILVVDGSGSMDGEPFDRVREAVHELVLAAAPRDRVELRFFTSSLGPIAFESPRGSAPVERAAAAKALLATRVPGGATDVLRALEELAASRHGAQARALVLLLTDGHTDLSTVERARAARQELSAENAMLRVIAIGENADETFLATLLLDGEDLVRSRDLADLGPLLAREVNAGRVRSDAGLAAELVAPTQSSSPPARELAAAWREAFARPLPIGAYERARTAPLAEKLWVSRDGEPVLAIQRVGRGLVAACTGSPTNGWTPFLARSPEILAPLLAVLGREIREPASRALGIELDGDELVLENVPADWPALVHASLRARPMSPATPGTTLELGELALTVPACAPGRNPLALRGGPLPAGVEKVPAGTPLEVELAVPGSEREVLGLRAPLASELRRPSSSPLLEDLPPPAPRASRYRGSAAHPLAAPFLGLGLGLLFVSSLALRRGNQGRGGSSRQ